MYAFGRWTSRAGSAERLALLFHVYRLITIYDCKIELSWMGKAEDGTEVKGKLTIPEVSHEITLDKLSDYVVGQT